jgi:hypothetical protein
MKVKFAKVDIRRSELCTIHREVPAWELPILKALFGGLNVTVLANTVRSATVPDPETEFDRLKSRYGRSRNEDGSIGMPFAEAVYGQFQSGIMQLERNIEASIVREAAEAVA